MQNSTSSNKRIAKNTIILYLRTILVMLISLYTSRVILEALGVKDYGIYAVVGGVVVMFSVVSSSLSSAISRFITFEIGRGNKDKLKSVFATSKTIQFVIAGIVLLLMELIGVWFMETKMQIPPERLDAARWILHFSLFTFCVNLLSVPYNACIIAHERMSAFAYMGIFDAVMKLLICFLVQHSPIDRLVYYGLLLMLLALITRIIYAIYCNKHFEESRVKAGFDKKIFKEMLGFSGWNFFNSTAFILNNQGVNMLMNIHFGVVVNAARGIAVQVETAVMQFVNNFTTAINPQITKSYASGDLPGMHKLVCRGAKFSYFSMLFLALPIIIEAEQILKLWLVDVPDHAVAFVQLSLVMGMCDCIGNSGYTACMATGKLRKYSLIITSVACLEFPLAWIFFSLDAIPEYAYYTYIAVKIAVLIARMFLLDSMVGLKVGMYMRNVFLPIINTTLVAIVLPIFISILMQPSIARFVAVGIASVVSVSLSTIYLGMTPNERNSVLRKLKGLYSKLTKNFKSVLYKLKAILLKLIKKSK